MTGPGRGKVWIDDMPIQTRKIHFVAEAGKLNKALLEINVGDVELSGEVDIALMATVFGGVTVIPPSDDSCEERQRPGSNPMPSSTEKPDPPPNPPAVRISVEKRLPPRDLKS